jgi:hypothetical protein
MDNYKQLTREEKRKFWQRHIDGWQKSGQSQTEYCHSQKLKKSTLGYWRTLLSREKSFIEIPVTIESQAAIDIIIKDTIKIQVRNGFDPDLLIQTVKTLEQLS